MQDNIVLERFYRFKAMLVSSYVDGNTLLDMVESFITSSDDDTPITEPIPVLEGQLSLFELF